MTRSRAERRHHHQRMLDKAKDITSLWGLDDWLNNEEYQMHVRKLAENRKKCSCVMCGNVRRMFKQKTIQEKRFEAKGNDE